MNGITFIGGGNMARSLIGGLIHGGADARSIHVVEPTAATRDALAADFGVAVHAEPDSALQQSEVVVLAVKPQVMPTVCASLANAGGGTDTLIISIAAGIRSGQIEHWLGRETAVVRVMPNTPALIGAGANGLFANPRVRDDQRERAQAILAASGLCAWVEDENLMDTVTAISGSAPAYFFLMVESLVDAAVAQGLDREVARRLAAQTCLGAGRMMIESGEAPAELRRRVTSPNGTTQAALESFARDDLPGIVAHAVQAAQARGRQLAAENDPS